MNDTSESRTETRRSREPQRDIFVRRWREGDRSCSPQGFDILVTNPYPGLRSFSRELRPYFFGREKQKDDLRRSFSESEAGRPRKANKITFVVGGSGSGKSSLTRAGLLAEIHGIPLQGHRGAWYIAEMRPEKDPVAQLRKSLHKVLHYFVELAFKGSTQPAADELKRRLQAAAADCGIAWGSDDDVDTVRSSFSQWLDTRIWPPSQQGRRRIETGEVFRFVDKLLYAFDTAASSGERAGPPRLLLHIDQFEEVFRDECDADGRLALIGLLRDIHEFRPDHLFVVATMRSEELHRFSEHAGMTEVINSSMYLVDLMADDDIESAIVDGAARLTSYWELPTKNTPTAPFTEEAVEALTEAFDEAGKAASHTADCLPLLQHFLPLVWERAVDDWIRRCETNADAILEITPFHLNEVPGWLGEPTAGPAGKSGDGSNDSRLGRCLNARANQVWQEALDEFGDDAEAEGILRVALCSLAQLDDQGKAVRRFVSVDQMLEAAGGERHGELRPKLQAALGRFAAATLIERRASEEPDRPDNYDVSHESLIRNWKMYKSWLEAERELKKRLYEIERSIDDLPEAVSYSWRSRFLGREKADAFAKISSEGVDDLGLIFQEQQPLYSKEWAVGALLQEYKADSVREIPEREDLGRRVEKIHDTWQLAKEWKDWGRRRQETREKRLAWGAAGAALVLVALATAIGIALWQLARNSELEKQLRIALSANDALNGQSIVHDRYLYKVIEAVQDYVPRKDLNEEQEGVLRQTAANIDGGIRKKYGVDLVQGAKPPQTSGPAEQANCMAARKGLQESVKLKNGSPALNLTFPQNRQYSGFPNLSAGWICMSPDGRWLLTVHPSGLPTGMHRMIWQKGDIPDVLPARIAGSDESRMLANKWYEDWHEDIKTADPSAPIARSDPSRNDEIAEVSGAPDVKFFEDEGFAGFQTTASGKPSLSVWTQTGLLDPDDTVPPPKGLGWQPCELLTRDSPNGKIRVCVIDHIKLDRSDKYLAIIMPTSGKNCDESVRCLATVKIHYGKADLPVPEPYIERDLVRAHIPLSWAQITHVAIEDDDWLWLKDVNEKTWRYAVGTGPVMQMLKRRWQDAKPASRLVPESCKKIDGCEDFLEDGDDSWAGLSRK